MAHKQAVLFDFDYTLADSSLGAEECINAALLAQGFPEQSREAICRTIGMPLDKTFQVLIGEQALGSMAALRAAFVTAADCHMAALTSLYPGVMPVLDALMRRNLKTGVVSTKFRYRIQEILARYEPCPVFDVIVGGEDVERPKPDPLGAARALDVLGLPAEAALYVGDSVIDAQFARASGLDFVCVLSGTTSREAFREYPVLGTMSRLEELPALIESL